MLSAMFSQEPPTGVYSGMTPCANSQQTNAGVLCPARLSSTRSIRKGGGSAGRVGFAARPSCQRSQAARFSPGPAAMPAVGAGVASRTAASSRLSHPWRTALGQVVAPSTRTEPSAGWNRVRILAVPLRMYSCGCFAGSPSGRHDAPAWGIVWNGPAWSVHQTGRPIASPNR